MESKSMRSGTVEVKAPGFFQGFGMLAKYLWNKLFRFDMDVFVMDPNLREAKEHRMEEQYISVTLPERADPLAELCKVKQINDGTQKTD
jgi:hypothetical protein